MSYPYMEISTYMRGGDAEHKNADGCTKNKQRIANRRPNVGYKLYVAQYIFYDIKICMNR